jgi:hypothetical protein
LAHAFGGFSTSGFGEFDLDVRVDFPLPYQGQPSMSYGFSIVSGLDTLRSTRYPICSGFVREWDIDAQGFYTGCWVSVVVLTRNPFLAPTDPDPEPEYLLQHDYTFLGVATKTVAPDLAEVL